MPGFLGNEMLRRLFGGSAVSARMDGVEARLQEISGALEALRRAQDSASAQLAGLHTRLKEIAATTEVWAVMDWIARATVEPGPRVSVVLPTRNRRGRLVRAIESVESQTYPNWELLIVNDSSTDDTGTFLSALKHERIRCFQGSGSGACAARNIALRETRGDLVAYLDDDNVMHPDWLKSVVWGFGQRPAATVLYGAFVVDDTARIDRKGKGDLPRLYFYRYDHHGLAHSNITDMGCIAHRANLPEARFDESLREMGDWDLFLRLTRDAPPLSLPAIACYYTTDAQDRLSHGPTYEADRAKVRAMNKR